MKNPLYLVRGRPGPTMTVTDLTDLVDQIDATMPLGETVGDEESGLQTRAKHGIGTKKPKT